ncbi:hypothetical protein JW905_00120 [bacterium]|nr:hypothetical protein [candidate division CSSED10-310 bacterium]
MANRPGGAGVGCRGRLPTVIGPVVACCVCLLAGSVTASAVAWRLSGEVVDYLGLTDLQQRWLVGDRWQFDDQSAARVKTELAGGGWIRLQMEYRVQVEWGDSIRHRRVAGFGGLTGEPVNERFMDLEAVLDEDGNYLLRHDLDRLWMAFHTGLFDLSIGRRALSWGSGYTWTPVDLINPFSPTAFERDIKPGTDMVLLELPLGDLAEAALVGKPVRDEDHEFRAGRSALLGRVRFNAGGVDCAVMGGKNRADSVAGLTLTGTLGGAGIWCEAAWTDPPGADPFVRAVAGGSYMFSGAVAVTGEYHYSSIGAGRRAEYIGQLLDDDLAARFQRGELYNLGRHYLSAAVEYELTPLMGISVSGIVNLQDGSFFVGPHVQRSLWQDVQVDVFAGVTTGSKNSEYGSLDLSPLGITKFLPNPDFFQVKLAYYW